MGDRETDRGPIGAAYRRIAEAIRKQPLEGATVGLVFDFEGTISKPDYEGFRVDPVRRKDRSVQVWIAVPAEAARWPDLDARLMDRAETAANLGLERLLVAKATDETVSLVPAFVAARRALGLHPRGSPQDAPETIVETSTDAEDDVVQVQIPLDDPPGEKDRLASLFRLEEEIDTRLRSEGLGEVDGNEVGGGEYTMFLRIPSQRRDRVTSMLDALLPPDASVT